jgi:DNA (cytosine-5)-methyltransferase 1
MENVGMLVHRGLREVLGSLAEIGYNAEWQDIRASDVGAPHLRERFFIIAYPESTGRWGYSRENENKKFKKCQDFWRDDKYTEILSTHETQYKIHSDDERVSDGIPGEMDRLKGIGNAIIPQIAEILFNQIKGLL